MAIWTDSHGRIVGQISQSAQRTHEGLKPVYLAEAVGLETEPCPRFACAKRMVEAALLAAEIQAHGTAA
jgi:hypothetical protein